jgi:CRISPR-associated protein Cmr1
MSKLTVYGEILGFGGGWGYRKFRRNIKKMIKVTFVCEIITPMFLAGADGKTPELRAASIKGALRFWWRAMNAHMKLEKMRKREIEIFGGVGDGGRRSRVTIQVIQPPDERDIEQSFWNEVPYVLKMSRNGKQYKQPTDYYGISYLFYSMFMLNERPYFKSGSSFKIKFLFSDESILSEVINAFFYLTCFGGLGSRTRRGAGSFQVKRVINDTNQNSEYYDKFQCCINDKSQLLKFLTKSIHIKESHDQNYSILKNSTIYIFACKENWKDALESTAIHFYNFRKEHRSNITKTPSFGFPIIHKRKRLKMIAGKRENNQLKLLNRRASNIIFKVVSIKDNYYPMILKLNGDFLPPDYIIMDKKGIYSDKYDNNIVNDFITYLTQNQNDYIEVKL